MNSRKTVGHLVLIIVIRCAAEIVINPLGDFPLNDDWAWGRTVQALLETGDFRPTDWGPMSLLSHVLWGAAFCLPAGFSFTALRLASFAASVVAGAGCYLLTMEASGSRALAVFAALTWLFNPITFALSATFMTEVPFVAMAVFATLFFARHLRSGSDRDLVIATLISMAAILSRQLALVLPLAFAVAVVALRGLHRSSIVRAVLPVLACYSVLAIFEHWLIGSGRLPALYRPLTVGFLYALLNTHGQPGHLGFNAWLLTMYLGCSLLPILLSIAPHMLSSLKSLTSRTAAISVGLSLLLVSVYLIGGDRLLMPLSGNIVTAQGIGPMALRDSYILLLANLAPLPGTFWAVVTAISVLGAVLLAVAAVVSVARVSDAFNRRQFGGTEAIGLLCFVCAACLLMPVFAESFFDRYVIPSFPFLAAAFGALVSASPEPHAGRGRILPTILLALFAAFSVAGTRDYLTWNRTRWALLDEVVTSKLAAPRQIDGGFEFNGWYLYSEEYVATSDKSWWWVDGDRYVVAFGPIPGWDIARERRFSRWLPPGEGRIVLLTRTP